jgi:hypothetical protein
MSTMGNGGEIGLLSSCDHSRANHLSIATAHAFHWDCSQEKLS